MSDLFLKEIQETFLGEAVEMLRQAEGFFLALEQPGDHAEILAHLKRIAHNFKGSGQAVGFESLAKFSHCLENLLIALSEGHVALSGPAVQLLLDCNDALHRDIVLLRADLSAVLNHDSLLAKIDGLLSDSSPGERPAEKHAAVEKDEQDGVASNSAANSIETSSPSPSSKDESIRIPMRRIDELLDAFGEQVIFLSALDHYKNDIDRHKDELVRTIFNLKKLAFDLQQSTLSLRMVNLKTLFSKLERAIRDAARLTGKNVRCVTVGVEQELDKIIVDQLSDPLIHMVRNAVDHGLEIPRDRAQKGKHETGVVTLAAKREGGAFVIEIHDDGRGLDPARIRDKAIEKGLIEPDESKTEKELFALIFENGFSTKENVSELSGRGVGMNVVKEMILALKGSYEIDSKRDRGTVFKIKLPISLSLFNGLLVQIGDNRYLVPSSQISEIINSKDVEIREISRDRFVAQVRDNVLDLVELNGRLGETVKAVKNSCRQMILVAEMPGGQVGFLVQKIHGIQRVVQKSLSPEMKSCPGAVGVTILGDGSPAVILDLKTLKELYLPGRSCHKVDQKGAA
jgi:two-component system chemotaxis sensor kinase CheA